MCSQCLIPVFDRIVDVTLYNTVYYYNTLYKYIYIYMWHLLCCCVATCFSITSCATGCRYAKRKVTK